MKRDGDEQADIDAEHELDHDDRQSAAGSQVAQESISSLYVCAWDEQVNATLATLPPLFIGL